MRTQTPGKSAQILSLEITYNVFCALVRAEVAILHALDHCSDELKCELENSINDIQCIIDWLIAEHVKASLNE